MQLKSSGSRDYWDFDKQAMKCIDIFSGTEQGCVVDRETDSVQLNGSFLVDSHLGKKNWTVWNGVVKC